MAMHKQIEGQLAMPFIGAVEGASLEAEIARTQRLVEGLAPAQLRELGRQHRRDGVHLHVARVIDNALIAAIRAAPIDREDVPNEHGVYVGESPFLKIDTPAILASISVARTRWGYIASWTYDWQEKKFGFAGSAPNLNDKPFRTAHLAAAHSCDELAAYLSERYEGHREKGRRLAVAKALGLLAEQASLLRSRLWPEFTLSAPVKKQARTKPPATRKTSVKKLRPPGVATTAPSKTLGRDGDKTGHSPSPDRRGSSGARRASDKKAGTGAGGSVRAAATGRDIIDGMEERP